MKKLHAMLLHEHITVRPNYARFVIRDSSKLAFLFI